MGRLFTIDTGTIEADHIADEYKDGATTTPSLRTLGTGSTQAAAGDHTHPGGGLSDGDMGDIVVSGSGTVLTVDAGAIGVAKMAASATDVLFGRSTSGAGAGEEIACTAAGRALLDDANASAQRTTLGLGTAATADTGTGAANVMTTAQADARYLARALAQPFTAP